MRRLISLGAALASLVATLLVLAAPPASAGGPTSVLAVNYNGSRASAALTGSAPYSDLETALDPYTAPAGKTIAPAAFMDARIRLTWMIHDVTPWRVDAISISGSDVWVETTMDAGTGKSLFETPTVRHRAKDAALLVATLTSLGVYGEQETAASPTPPTPGAGAVQSVAADAGSTSGSAAPAPNSIPWWATGGAAVLALGIGVVLGRRGRRDHADPGHAPEAEPVSPVGFSPDRDPARR